eukprot:TRINITY_DN9015_c0_g1_i1.p1 TRINITY_DN9015_c0_g1~~TRINITY_DN9015_c0_g1_i1.p1  ORF type:complete len:570 (+),score=173.44 TRINITY_DN9015_c0_g1_i1:108-1817(+)
MGSRADFLAQLGLTEADVRGECGAPQAKPAASAGWDRIIGSDRPAGGGYKSTPPREPMAQPCSSARAAFLSEMGISAADAAPPPGVLGADDGEAESCRERQPHREPSLSGAGSRRESFLREMGISPGDLANPDGVGQGSEATPLYGRRTPEMAATPSPRRAYSMMSDRSCGSARSQRDAAAYQRSCEREAGFDYGLCDSPPAQPVPRAGRRSEPPLSDSIQAKIEGLPADPSAAQLKEVGNDCYRSKNYTAAGKYYTMALEKSPDDFVLLSNRSAAYLQGPMISGPAMALRDAERCVSMHPDRFKGWNRKGDALFKMKKYEQATECYQRSLQINPSGNDAAATSLRQCEELLGWTKRTKLPNQLEREFQEKHLNKGMGYTRSPGASSCSTLYENQPTATEMVEAAEVGRSYRQQELDRYRQHRGSGYSGSARRSGGEAASTSAGCSPTPSTEAPVHSRYMHSEETSPDYASSSQGTTSATSSVHVAAHDYSTEAARAYREHLMASYRKKKDVRMDTPDSSSATGRFGSYQGTNYRRVQEGERPTDPAGATDYVGKAISADAEDSRPRNW